MTRHLNHRDKMNSFLMKMILICSNQMSWKQKKRKEHFRTLKNITTWKQLGELEITWRKLQSYLTKILTLTLTTNSKNGLRMDHSRSLVMVCFRNFMTSIRYNAKLIRKKIWLFRFLIVEGDTIKNLNSFGMSYQQCVIRRNFQVWSFVRPTIGTDLRNHSHISRIWG